MDAIKIPADKAAEAWWNTFLTACAGYGCEALSPEELTMAARCRQRGEQAEVVAWELVGPAPPFR